MRRGFSGDAIESKSEWHEGQGIEILHDPAGEIKPCITGMPSDEPIGQRPDADRR
jgi:hypothetical protein